MTRAFALATLTALLPACGTDAPGYSEDEIHEASLIAQCEGDPGNLLRLKRRAANDGDLDATYDLARIYSDGHVQVGRGFERVRVPVFTFPGQAGRWQRRYESRRDELARAGDSTALRAVASDLCRTTVRDGRIHEPTPQALDSVLAIRHRLGEIADPRLNDARRNVSSSSCLFSTSTRTSHAPVPTQTSPSAAPHSPTPRKDSSRTSATPRAAAPRPPPPAERSAC